MQQEINTEMLKGPLNQAIQQLIRWHECKEGKKGQPVTIDVEGDSGDPVVDIHDVPVDVVSCEVEVVRVYVDDAGVPSEHRSSSCESFDHDGVKGEHGMAVDVDVEDVPVGGVVDAEGDSGDPIVEQT